MEGASNLEGFGDDLKKTTVMVAVKSSLLLKVIEHLFRHEPGLEMVVVPDDGATVAQHASLVHPALIVTNAERLGHEACRALDAVRRSSPSTQLILLSSMDVLPMEAPPCDGAAYVDEEQIVRALPATVKRLALAGILPAHAT